MRRLRSLCAFSCMAAARLMADNNPPPTQSPFSVNPPFRGAAINQPFPDNYYGADHGGSSLGLGYPYASPFGFTDHSHGVFTYTCAPFTPRNSEGVYGMDVWLEQQDGSGNWNAANMNGGVPDQGRTYQPVNTPNPGPSASYTFTWTFRGAPLPAYSNFRVFIYVYLYNQGGGSQGNFYVPSATGAVSTGAANDAPRINWTASYGSLNPTQVTPGQTYIISADAQDDNGNLATVSINKNGVPFAYAGGGNGFSGNSYNGTIDPAGLVTYTAWAADSSGASSPTITWTVNVTLSPPVGSFDGVTPNSLQQGQTLYGSGWAADPQMGAPVSSVQILIDQGASGSFAAALGGYRPDVQQANAAWGHWSALDITNSGWTFSLPTAGLSVGAHNAVAVAYDSYGLSGTLQTQSFTVTAPPPPPPPPQYTLSTFAVGNGSVTAGGTYPANAMLSVSAAAGAGAYFTGWTGGISSSVNPLPVTMSGDLTLYANFTPLQAQAISFSPPASAIFPGPAIALNATASSGLPVSFAIVSGPGSLSGNQLTLTGVGAIVLQAVQGGNGQWLAATPVNGTITVNAPFPITRIRFNAAGREARVLNQDSRAGASMIWSDPAGILASPWPSFANPQLAPAGPANALLPAVPITGVAQGPAGSQ